MHTEREKGYVRRLQAYLPVSIVLFLLAGPSSGPVSAAVPIWVGSNVNITRLAGNQAEGTIAMNPNDTQELFFASNPGATALRSTDGGATWVAAGAGISASCCDNVADWDAFGNLFLVNLNSGATAVNLFLSTDGGANFTLLQTIDTGNVDQPSVKAGANSVWVTWNDGDIKARGAAVTGLGAANIGAFTAEQAAPGTFGQFGDIAIGPGGEVVVVYQESNSPCPCRIFANTDADGLGAGGFGAQVTVTSMNVNTFDFIQPQSGRSIDSEANLAWDRSMGAFDGRLYLVYTDESPDESDDTDIFVRFSDDNGVNWSAAVQVNDDGTTTSQFLPNISIDQTTGHVAITWHDARNDPTNNNAQFFGAVSDTGGASFGANFQISTGTSNDNAAGSGVDYGDYTWSVFHDGRLQPVWADNSNSTNDNPAGANSTFDMYTARILIDNAPVAMCQDATVETDPGVCTAALASVDNGSFDPDGDSITLEQAPPPPYDKGTTNVTLTVTDDLGAFDSCTAVVTVNDTEPPAITCPVPQQLECTGPDGATATFSPTVVDNCGFASASCSPPSGSVFPLGTTDITCTATDDSMNASSCGSSVIVVDTTPPQILATSASPDMLWPPNHKMVPVTVSVSVKDTCDPTPMCKITSVSSNEPINGPGDGNTMPDWVIAGLSVDLRAERAGPGSGRVYTIEVTCTDESENDATAAVKVVVPHSQGK